MNISKEKIKSMNLRNSSEFRLLKCLFCLYLHLNGKRIFLKQDRLWELFHLCPKRVDFYFRDLEKRNFIFLVRLKTGEPMKKNLEYAITILPATLKLFPKESDLEKRIKEEYVQRLQDFEDFLY